MESYNVLEEIKKINEDFFKLFWRVENNVDALDEPTKKEMKEVLHKQYSQIITTLVADSNLEFEREKYRNQEKLAILKPDKKAYKKWFRWRPNNAAIQMNEKIAYEVQNYFNKEARAIERLAAALEQTDENDNGEALKPTADDESATGNEQSEQPPETPENGQNTDEGASDAREQTEQTDEKTPADKPEESPTDGAAEEPEPVNQTGEQAPEPKPHRRRKSKPDTTPDNEQMPGQMTIEMPPDTDDPGQTDE
ncbi:MAG: hypothetical protein ACI4L9_02310 [Candidatus Coproplasma sp.]